MTMQAQNLYNAYMFRGAHKTRKAFRDLVEARLTETEHNSSDSALYRIMYALSRLEDAIAGNDDPIPDVLNMANALGDYELTWATFIDAANKHLANFAPTGKHECLYLLRTATETLEETNHARIMFTGAHIKLWSEHGPQLEIASMVAEVIGDAAFTMLTALVDRPDYETVCGTIDAIISRLEESRSIAEQQL